MSLHQNYFPMLRFKEHLESRIDYIKDKLVKVIDAEYKATLGFPVPTNVRAVSNAVKDLCREGIIGIQHSRGNYCNQNPSLTETEFFNARITDPFEGLPPERLPETPVPTEIPPILPGEDETAEEVCPRCGQEICVCPKKATISLAVPPQISAGKLREEVASRLQEYEDADITNVIYKIFFQQDDIGDMSTLPAILRGNLSGYGDVSAEITIAKNRQIHQISD